MSSGAALLILVIFNRGGWLKYIITVLIAAIACFFLRDHAAIINKMTLIALITLVVSWIVSMAVFDKESKVKSKVISFACDGSCRLPDLQLYLIWDPVGVFAHTEFLHPRDQSRAFHT